MRVEVFYNNLIKLRMELIITFFIIFALGIILALFFTSLYKIEWISKFNFSSTSNLLSKFYNYFIFSFSKPNRRFCR